MWCLENAQGLSGLGLRHVLGRVVPAVQPDHPDTTRLEQGAGCCHCPRWGKDGAKGCSGIALAVAVDLPKDRFDIAQIENV